jgi:hypothetical protein
MARETPAEYATTPETPNSETASPALAPRATFEAARRVVESVVIAVATSTGLYLVGSVYVAAFYDRMSIEVTALDLAPPYIALQAVHVMESLLNYPLALLLVYVIARAITTRFPTTRTWPARLDQRFGRLALLIANVAIISPLLLPMWSAVDDPALADTNSVLSEVASMMVTTGIIFVCYLIWLSLGPRQVILTPIREHKLLPIALLFALYLLDALVTTAHDAAADAEILMTGVSDSSIAVTFTMANGVAALPNADLILVTVRNGHYFVVERQPVPPSPRPIAYAIPVRAVDAIRMQRTNEAAPAVDDFEYSQWATPAGP